MELKAFLSGKVLPIETVNDPVFSAKILGDGVAIEPSSEVIVAPFNGTITATFPDTKHAMGITSENGMNCILHEGTDTLCLSGQGFELFVKKGDKVKAGDKLFSFNANLLKENNLDAVCILAITNSDKFPDLKLYTNIDAVAGETVIGEV